MSLVFKRSDQELSDWIRRELVLERELKIGDKGPAVKRLQEWLNLRGYGLSIDSDYGRVTADAVRRFQVAKRLSPTGRANERTFAKLVEPMRAVLRQGRRSRSVNAGVLTYAKAHLAQNPREVGGPNRGPWVRLYMKGAEDLPWCAGFVSFVLGQAVESVQAAMPIAGSFSCDALAAQAKQANLFVAERNPRPAIPSGSIFLVRRTETDWTHTGFVAEAQTEFFRTIEGNTNDDGVREGYEVCTLTRGYAAKDFEIGRAHV